MLRGIRTASTNWLGRAVMGVVMGLLAASFAVWGINDIFHGFGRSTLAKVGGTEISIDRFRQMYNDRLQVLARQVGRPVSAEQAREFGLGQQVLSELIAEASLDQRVRQLRLGVSDEELVRRVTGDKAFFGPNGKFDRARFELALRSRGYTEQRFLADQRKVVLRQQIVDSLSGNVPVPKTWLDAINQLQNEQRIVEYVALGQAQAGDIPPPTPEELSQYFDARKIMFRAPEVRRIEVVAVTPAEVARTIEISDADVKAAYEQNRGGYTKPERRRIEQIVFPNMADADAAEARLKDGLSFAALAAERGLKDSDIDLGAVTKADVADPVVADAAFALKDGEVSAPLRGRFGTVIVTVTKIEPAETKPLAELAPWLRTDLALERAKAEVRTLREKIEDERAGGASLAQVAEKFKLRLVAYDVDRSGRDPSGKPVANIPQAAQVISAAFASDIGVDNDPIDADGGYVWYNVASVTAAHDRPLDEVKNEVEARWRADQVATRVKKKTDELLEKLKGGASFDELAKADGLKLETADDLKRGKATNDVSARAIAAIFHTPKDGFGSAEGQQPGDWIVFKVTGVITPTPETNLAETQRLEDVVRRQEADDIYVQYIATVENDLGTTVNEAALDQALGNGSPDTN